MFTEPENRAKAHRFFAVECFNTTWDLIDLKARNAEQDEEMIERAFASLWHWRQRPDHTPRNVAMGCWQVSRVLALAGRGDEALRYGERAARVCADEALDAFMTGFAHEARARAQLARGDEGAAAAALADARAAAATIADADDRAHLERDLDEIAGRIA
jgi:hypothetical protein